MVCLVPGCGKKQHSRKLCASHYKAWKRGGGEQSIVDFVAASLERENEVPAKSVEPAPAPASCDQSILDRYRAEWADVKFEGPPETVARKREVLAQLEDNFYWVVACDQAGVKRREYMRWVDEDPEFEYATLEATEAASQRDQWVMRKEGRSGKPNIKALYGQLNMWSGWNPMARTVDQMRNGKFVEEIAKALRETIPPDSVGPALERIATLASRADRLPSGAKL